MNWTRANVTDFRYFFRAEVVLSTSWGKATASPTSATRMRQILEANRSNLSVSSSLISKVNNNQQTGSERIFLLITGYLKETTWHSLSRGDVPEVPAPHPGTLGMFPPPNLKLEGEHQGTEVHRKSLYCLHFPLSQLVLASYALTAITLSYTHLLKSTPWI